MTAATGVLLRAAHHTVDAHRLAHCDTRSKQNVGEQGKRKARRVQRTMSDVGSGGAFAAQRVAESLRKLARLCIEAQTPSIRTAAKGMR